MSEIAAAQAFLLRTQNSDGGWGYVVGHASNVEATAVAALALTCLAGEPAAARRGVAWLQAAQRADGGWGLTADDAESGWQTAWALLALVRCRGDEAVVQRGVAQLLAAQPMHFDRSEDVRWVKAVLGINPNLRGWPWLPGQVAWVEPTALTLLALAPWAAAPEVSPRLAEGVGYLQDRRCNGGGWNVGNPVMFSRPLPPRAVPTAWVLLALAAVAPQAIQDDDVRVLRSEMLADGGASALAWGLLALAALDQEERVAADRLRAGQAADGGWDTSPYHTAAALLALAGGWP